MNESRKGSRILAVALCLMMLLGIAVPAMAANVVGYVTINVDKANVYSDAAKTNVIGYFVKGNIVAVEGKISASNVYAARLRTDTADVGYISVADTASYTTKLPSGKAVAAAVGSSGSGSTTTQTGKIYNVSSYTNFRETASTSGKLISKVNLGETVTILGTQGDYYKASYNGKTGYLAKAYVQLTTSTNTGTGTGTGTGSTSTPVAAQGITTASITLYKAADKKSGSAGTLGKGIVVDITAQSGDFYQVKSGTKAGFVEKAKLTVLPSTSSASGTGTVKENSTRMYAAPITSSTSVGTLSKNTSVTIIGDATTFYQVKNGSKTGYVEKSKLTVSGDTGSSGGTSTPSTGGPDTGKVTVGKGEIAVKPNSSAISAVSTALASAQKTNSDVVGYIYIAGTNISQPILFRSSKDVHYYATRNLKKASSSAGSIYTFYKGLMRNNTITGHNMRESNGMFHQLHHIQEKALGYSTCQHAKCKSSSLASVPNIKTSATARIWDISMFGYNKWEVWAMYEVKADEPSSTLVYNIDPLSAKTPAQVKAWVDYQKNRSEIKFNTAISTDDIFLTVYTCGTEFDYATAQSRLYFFLKAIK